MLTRAEARVDKAYTQRGSHSEAFVLQASDQGESLGQGLACLKCLELPNPPFHREQALVWALQEASDNDHLLTLFIFIC